MIVLGNRDFDVAWNANDFLHGFPWVSQKNDLFSAVLLSQGAKNSLS